MRPLLRRPAGPIVVMALLVAGCASTEPEPATQSALPTLSDTAAATTSPGPKIPAWPVPTTDLPPVDPDAQPRGVPDLADVDLTDPDAVAQTYVQMLLTSDTRTDTSPVAAAQRAAPLLANTNQIEDLPTGGDPAQWWRELATAGGYTTVKATALEQLELPDDAYRMVPIQAATTYRDTELEDSTAVIDVLLVDVDGQWRVETTQTRTTEDAP